MLDITIDYTCIICFFSGSFIACVINMIYLYLEFKKCSKIVYKNYKG